MQSFVNAMLESSMQAQFGLTFMRFPRFTFFVRIFLPLGLDARRISCDRIKKYTKR